MTTDDLLKRVEARSLEIVLTRDGNLTLKGNVKAATPNLMRVLKLPCHREEILRRLGAKSVVIVETQALDPCPKCGRILDVKARCWSKSCGWRKCQACGGNTGNVFIAHCNGCQCRLGLSGGWND